MKFNNNKPIYLQIGDLLMESILDGKYEEANKIPSIREMASLTQTNPNTVVRAYSSLLEKGVIYKKRGKGFFVESEATKIITSLKKKKFIEKELPRLFHLMEMLDFSLEELQEEYKNYCTKIEKEGEL
ncbi:MAG: GntR family transcriptional regulator [Myxococcota bacterium]